MDSYNNIEHDSMKVLFWFQGGLALSQFWESHIFVATSSPEIVKANLNFRKKSNAIKTSAGSEPSDLTTGLCYKITWSPISLKMAEVNSTSKSKGS